MYVYMYKLQSYHELLGRGVHRSQGEEFAYSRHALNHKPYTLHPTPYTLNRVHKQAFSYVTYVGVAKALTSETFFGAT
jgi:hypothetical protein